MTVTAPDLFEPRRRYRGARVEAYLRENPDVDPAILAVDLGIPRHFVMAYQRRLGLRKILNHTTKRQK